MNNKIIDDILLDLSVEITHLKSLENLIYDKEFFNKLQYLEQRSYRMKLDEAIYKIRDKYREVAPLLKEYEKEEKQLVNINYIRILKNLRKYKLL